MRIEERQLTFVDLNNAQLGAVKTGVMMMTSTIIDVFDHQNTVHWSGRCSEDGSVQLLVREGCEGNIMILALLLVVNKSSHWM